MIEIFKTNVREKNEADEIVSFLLKRNPGFKINFDLEDCDNILRIEGIGVKARTIMSDLEVLGYSSIQLY